MTKDFEVEIRIRNNHLLQRRRELGMSQAQLARAMEITSTEVSKYETMRTSPVRSGGGWKQSALRFAEFHGVSPDELWPEAVLRVRTPVAVRTMEYDEIRRLTPGRTDGRLLESEAAAFSQQMLAKLDGKEAVVIRLRFFEDKTLEEIGTHVGVSRERVRQIEIRAIRRMREAAHDELVRAKTTRILGRLGAGVVSKNDYIGCCLEDDRDAVDTPVATRTHRSRFLSASAVILPDQKP